MTTMTKTLIAAAALLAVATGAQAKTGKCITPDGNVVDCVLAEPEHVAKAKKILGGGIWEENDADAPAEPESPGGGGIEPLDLDIASE